MRLTSGFPERSVCYDRAALTRHNLKADRLHALDIQLELLRHRVLHKQVLHQLLAVAEHSQHAPFVITCSVSTRGKKESLIVVLQLELGIGRALVVTRVKTQHPSRIIIDVSDAVALITLHAEAVVLLRHIVHHQVGRRLSFPHPFPTLRPRLMRDAPAAKT